MCLSNVSNTYDCILHWLLCLTTQGIYGIAELGQDFLEFIKKIKDYKFTQKQHMKIKWIFSDFKFYDEELKRFYG